MNFSTRTRVIKPALFSKDGVCVTQNAQAAQVGADVLRNGGNAFDAAVAVSFALGVLEPWMSGIGGGGALVMRGPGGMETLDFGLIAPRALDPSVYALTDGYCTDMFPWRRVVEDRNVEGVHSIATPGLVAGMGALHDAYGRMPWAELLTPAIDLARQGVQDDWYSQVLVASFLVRLKSDPGLADMFLVNGLPKSAADLATGAFPRRMPKLADTLAHLAQAGWQDFYNGDIAHSIIRDMQAKGSTMSADDLRGYKARFASAQSVQFAQSEVYVSPPLTAGKTLARVLELIARHHTNTADGVFFPNIARALSTAQSERWTDDGDTNKADCTTHFAVSDAQGNLVCVTQTLLSAFGSGVMLSDSGILMNNGMLWFDPEPGRPNSVAAGKKCLMNICPAILRHKDHYHAIGAAGGRRILSAVAQMIAFMALRGDTPADAIHASRIDCSLENSISIPPALADFADHFDKPTQIEPALPWPLTYAIPSILTSHPRGAEGCADPISPWADAAAPDQDSQKANP